jgi:hypothetical protein
MFVKSCISAEQVWEKSHTRALPTGAQQWLDLNLAQPA